MKSVEISDNGTRSIGWLISSSSVRFFFLRRRVLRLSRKTNAFLDLNQSSERFFCCQFAL
jgi:hypothetical protein